MAGLKERYNLSPREIEVIELVVQGKSNQEAADKLFVVEKTVKFHLTNVYKKMGIKSRAQLIVKVMMSRDGEPRETAIDFGAAA